MQKKNQPHQRNISYDYKNNYQDGLNNKSNNINNNEGGFSDAEDSIIMGIEEKPVRILNSHVKRFINLRFSIGVSNKCSLSIDPLQRILDIVRGD